MSLSIILEVVIVMSFLFATLSLITSGASEMISSVLSLRAKTLEKGMKNLLNDPAGSKGIADDIYAHPLIKSLFRGEPDGKHRKPSYIPSDTFTLALLDAKIDGAIGAIDATTAAVGAVDDKKVKAAIEALPKDLGDTLNLLWRDARGDITKFRKSVEGWFDQGMERVSGWYRRLIQIILFGLGVLVALGLNVNTLTVAERIWIDAPLRNAVVEQARRATPPPATDEGGVKESLDNIESSLKTIDGLSLPIGWGEQARPHTVREWFEAVPGWLMTAVAISLGAPFWFDLLGRVARLRSTGVRLQTAKPTSAETENKKEQDET